MRSRTLREGSLGLFILTGIGLLALLVLWLQGVNLGRNSYRFVVEFGNVIGIQTGSPVRYRGVVVGKIVAIQPGVNGVDVTVEITSLDLLIPQDVTIEVNQAGLIGEGSLDLKPMEETLSNASTLVPPTEINCDSSLIICQNDRLQGEIGVSFAELARSSIRFTKEFSNPEFVTNLTELTENTAEAAEGITELTKNLSSLSQSIDQQLDVLSDYAVATTDSVDRTASQLSLTAGEINRLAKTVNNLVDSNRANLVATLDNVNLLSQDLRAATSNFVPLLTQASQTLAKVDRGLTQVERSTLLSDLEKISENAVTLSSNATEASANLRDVTAAVNDPTNLLLLEQTLNSARSTFQNVQKITSDLDSLTGDPNFREDLRRLVNGLSGLVSSTEQLQQQVQTAQTLAPLENSVQEIDPHGVIPEKQVFEKRRLGRWGDSELNVP